MDYKRAIYILEIRDPSNGHLLTAEEVMEQLKSDVVQMVKSPGSCASVHMADVFQGHGWKLPDEKK